MKKIYCVFILLNLSCGNSVNDKVASNKNYSKDLSISIDSLLINNFTHKEAIKFDSFTLNVEINFNRSIKEFRSEKLLTSYQNIKSQNIYLVKNDSCKKIYSTISNEQNYVESMVYQMDLVLKSGLPVIRLSEWGGANGTNEAELYFSLDGQQIECINYELFQEDTVYNFFPIKFK